MLTLRRIIRHTAIWRVVIVGTACLVANACGSDTGSGPLSGDDAAKAATVFTQLSDSIAKAGGDSSIARAYGSLADALRMGLRVSPVAITIDGVATPFMATAQQTMLSSACSGCASLPPFVLRSFIAWQASDPGASCRCRPK
ncbi:MAG: hypothetical protein M3Z05_12350 [Gemmatimonadota bacterium]|nr:hypothetical protein [Gemmatimonadota bacterium]